MNSNLILFSLYSIKNKTAFRNTQLRPSSTSRDIFLPSIDAPTNGHIAFLFQSWDQPIVEIFLIRLMLKYWATKWPVPITSSNGSKDLYKSQMEVAGVSSRRIMFQHIESWLIYFTYFKVRPYINRIYHWILQPIPQHLILCSPEERAIALVIILNANPAGNGVWKTPVPMHLYFLHNGAKYTFNWSFWEDVPFFIKKRWEISPSFCLK